MAHVTLKGKEIHTHGELPKVGSHAPDFILIDADLKPHSLADFKGKKKILSIVPSLDTPTCSLSTKKFNDAVAEMPHVYLLVISADLPFAQKRVCGAEKLTHVISLSLMRSKKFAEDYGVLLIEGPIEGLCTRAVILLDEHDKVLYTQLVPEISQEPDYEAVLNVLRQNAPKR